MLPEEVIRKYSATVYRIAFARTGTKADADDIYQEVFLRYIRKQPEFREEEHAKAWFIRVAINCANKFTGGKIRKTEVAGGENDSLRQSNAKSTYAKCVTIEEKMLAISYNLITCRKLNNIIYNNIFSFNFNKFSISNNKCMRCSY